MMKKTITILMICLALCAPARAQENDPVWMKVVNCEEWVSLREKPDASSECLVEVPLGALVENCAPKTKTFSYAEYQGLSGYILTQYLEPVEQEQMNDHDVIDRGEWIAMRVEAADDAPVIQWLAPGTRVAACMDLMNGFAYGQCNGMKGYVRLSDLETGEAAPLP